MGRIVKGFALFTVGAAAGGAAAAMLTPKTGRALRKAVRKEVRHQRNSATRFARNVAGEFRSAYEGGRNAAEKIARPFRAAS